MIDHIVNIILTYWRFQLSLRDKHYEDYVFLYVEHHKTATY